MCPNCTAIVADPDVTRLLWHHQLLPQGLWKRLCVPQGWKRLELKLGVSRRACKNTPLMSIYCDESTDVVSRVTMIVKATTVISLLKSVTMTTIIVHREYGDGGTVRLIVSFVCDNQGLLSRHNMLRATKQDI